MLEVERLMKRDEDGIPLLDDVSFALHGGEILGGHAAFQGKASGDEEIFTGGSRDHVVGCGLHHVVSLDHGAEAHLQASEENLRIDVFRQTFFQAQSQNRVRHALAAGLGQAGEGLARLLRRESALAKARDIGGRGWFGVFLLQQDPRVGGLRSRRGHRQQPCSHRERAQAGQWNGFH